MLLRRTAEAFAPAKINLTLHVTGQRSDGYHLLDSLVVFAGVGDDLRAEASDALSLAVTGPMAAGVPTDASNLVLKAGHLFNPAPPVRVTLTKRLPAAAGIGGGSSDAAACLRVLSRMTGQEVPGREALLSLGADVPVCLKACPTRMVGIGEILTDVPRLPPLWMVLVNPGVAVPTPPVFRGLARKDNPPMPGIPRFEGAPEAITWIAAQRNDLERPAQEMAPVIGTVLRRLAAASGCGLARMSGSGATCFGLFAQEDAATQAAAAIAVEMPDWWCATAAVLSEKPAIS